MAKTRTIWAAAALLILALATSCSSNDQHVLPAPSATPVGGAHDLAGAQASVVEQFADISRDDRGAEWDLLHPAHQALITRERWISCNSSRHLNLKVKVVDSKYVHASIPALGDTDAWQLRIDITGNIKETVESVYRVERDGRWRWVLDAPGVEHVRNGQCP